MINLIEVMSKIDTNFNPVLSAVDYQHYNLRSFGSEYYDYKLDGGDVNIPTDVLYSYSSDQHARELYYQRLNQRPYTEHVPNSEQQSRWFRQLMNIHWNGCVLRKTSDANSVLKLGADPTAQAINDLLEVEQVNYQTNNRLASLKYKKVPGDLDVLLNNLKCIFKELLGDLDHSQLGIRITTGATTDFSTSRNIVESLSAEATITQGLRDYLNKYGISDRSHPIEESYEYNGQIRHTKYTNRIHFDNARITNHCHYFAIPKYWNVDRSGVKSPTGNMAIGASYADSLERHFRVKTGIDLRHAPEKHKWLARISSRNQIATTYATIDKKGGSDYIARNILQFIPEDHAELLDALRCTEMLLPDGSTLTLEMLMPQGMTCTFIFECICFYAIAKACGFDNPYINGDDLIVENSPSKIALYYRLCAFLGIQINPDKSLHARFDDDTVKDVCARESCGGDYILGYSVRPYYFKQIILRRPSDAYKALNGIRDRYFDPVTKSWFDYRFYMLYYAIISQLPEKYRLFGPDTGDNDTHIIHQNEKLYRYNRKLALTTNNKLRKMLDVNQFSCLKKNTRIDESRKTSLYFTLNPDEAPRSMRHVYQMYHEIAHIAVVSSQCKGKGPDGLRCIDFYRNDDSTELYTHGYQRIVSYDEDNPIGSMSQHYKYFFGMFFNTYEYIKVTSALRHLEKHREQLIARDEEQKALRKELLGVRTQLRNLLLRLVEVKDTELNW